jgi:galactokinase
MSAPRLVDPAALRRGFEETHGAPPRLIVRAPGRVNLIGEHTDYSLLPVLPVAIDRGTLCAVAPTDDDRVIAVSCSFPGEVTIDRSASPPDAGLPGVGWGRYLHGVLHELADLAPGQGARILLDSDLPTTGGLSSSSSLTIGLLAALDGVWDLGLGLEGLVARGIVAERQVGVESGGMDQTVIAFARAGAALRIDFAPPSRRAVALPEDLVLVVAASGEEAAKGGGAKRAYNERVIGCRLAAALLAHELGRELGSPPLLHAVAGHASALELARALPEQSTASEVAARLGLEVEPLVRFTAGSFEADAPVRVGPVARHVLSEAVRVDDAERALLGSELEVLGRLLDASHRSLAEDFRCSTPALDRLCGAMRAAGALGARLTGAGFGGYAIAAAREERAPAVIAAAIAATGGPAFAVRASPGLGSS